MIRVAIVEDNEIDADWISSCVLAWCAKNNDETMNCTVYSDHSAQR